MLCLAIEHVEPFEAAIKEVARVLTPGGRFLLLLVHPLLQAPGSGWVEVVDSDEHFCVSAPTSTTTSPQIKSDQGST